MDLGKPPIIFENPTYTSRDTAVKVAQPTTTPVRNHSPCCQVWLLLDLVLWNNVPLGSSQPSLHGRKHTGRLLSFTPCSNRTDPRTEGLKTIRILGFGSHSLAPRPRAFSSWVVRAGGLSAYSEARQTLCPTHTYGLSVNICELNEWMVVRSLYRGLGYWAHSLGSDWYHKGVIWGDLPACPCHTFLESTKVFEVDRQVYKFPLMRPYYSLIF